jgi:hypothetical protein
MQHTITALVKIALPFFSDVDNSATLNKLATLINESSKDEAMRCIVRWNRLDNWPTGW